MCTDLKKWGYKEAEHSGIAEAHMCDRVGNFKTVREYSGCKPLRSDCDQILEKELSMRQSRLWGVGRSPHMRAVVGNRKSARGYASQGRT